MTHVGIYKTRENAREKQKLLADQGIASKLLVDPMESMYPALSEFEGVAIVVAMEFGDKAKKILDYKPIKPSSPILRQAS